MTISLDIRDPVQSKLESMARRLQSIFPREIDLDLKRMVALLDKIGNPHNVLPPVIHVAGTNGKGSTTAFLRAILESAGYKAHVYTSPHLVRFNERIRISGQLVDDAELLETVDEVMAANGDNPITFFELTTAAAFRLFHRYPADFVILETGMGGRLDATNIIATPAATVITPISMDHMEFLGDSIEKIAAEKAAIQKPGTISVVSAQNPAAQKVIADYAAAICTKTHMCGIDWWAFKTGDQMHYRSSAWNLTLPMPNLFGGHQIDNAATAVAAIEQISGRWRVPTDAIIKGVSSAEWPARMQRLRTGPAFDILRKGDELWLDGGHNAGAGMIIADALESWRDRPCYLIWGMLQNKDAGAFLEPMRGKLAGVYAVAIDGEDKSAAPEDLQKTAAHLALDAHVADGVLAAINMIQARDARPKRILIAGSLYLAGRILSEYR